MLYGKIYFVSILIKHEAHILRNGVDVEAAILRVTQHLLNAVVG